MRFHSQDLAVLDLIFIFKSKLGKNL
jgi:hypothetical protein